MYCVFKGLVDIYTCCRVLSLPYDTICTCHLLWFHFINIYVNQFSILANIYKKDTRIHGHLPMQIVIIYLTPLNFLDSLSNQIHEIGAQRKLMKPQLRLVLMEGYLWVNDKSWTRNNSVVTGYMNICSYWFVFCEKNVSYNFFENPRLWFLYTPLYFSIWYMFMHSFRFKRDSKIVSPLLHIIVLYTPPPFRCN